MVVYGNFMSYQLMYRVANKGLHVLLSRTQAGPGRTVKQEQEEISRNHVQTFICLYVDTLPRISYFIAHRKGTQSNVRT